MAFGTVTLLSLITLNNSQSIWPKEKVNICSLVQWLYCWSFVMREFASLIPPSAVNFYPDAAKGYQIWPDFYPDKRIWLFAHFFKNLSGQCYGKIENFANFDPDLGTGS